MVQSVTFSAVETGKEAPPEAVKVADAKPGDRPAWLPENFKAPEDLAKSYAEAQAEITRLKQSKPAEDPAKAAADKAAADKAAADKVTADKAEADRVAALTPEQKAAEAKTKADAEAAKKAADATSKVDLPAFEQKYLANGKLEDADYADLEKKGFSKADVDGYIAWKTDSGNRMRADVLAPIGGEEGFAIVSAWAKQGGYTAEQAKSYNDAVTSGDKGRMEQAVKAIKADFDKAKGVPPGRSLTPTNVPNAAGNSYQSNAQFLADINTDLYRNDPAERERVKQKLSRSKI